MKPDWRIGGRFRKPNGSRAIPGSISGTISQVRAGTAPGENTTDRVWAVRRTRSGKAWRRKAGDLYVSGLHALLREAPEQWNVHRLAENGEETHGGQAARH